MLRIPHGVGRTLACALLAHLTLAACKGGGEHAAHDPDHHGDHTEHADREAHADHAAGDPGIVHLGPAQVTAAGIQTVPVEVRTELDVLEASGQIEPADDRQARVGARVPGRVTTLKARVGDLVQADQVLAVIESPELGRAKADYLATRAEADLARTTVEREQALFERKINAEADWRQAQAKAVRADAELQAAENRLHALGVDHGGLPGKVGHLSSSIAARTPIAGVVVERPVTLGEMIDPGDTLFVVMDLSEVWILVDVFERDLAQVAVGQRVAVKVAAYPEQVFTGKVSLIGAVVEARSRAIKVRVVLANPGGKLKPGMFGRVTLTETTGDAHQHLFVPVAAVQRTGEGAIVFVPTGEPGAFRARRIRTGHEVGASIAVEEGLRAGEVVVTTGSFVLKSELNKDALGEGGHHH